MTVQESLHSLSFKKVSPGHRFLGCIKQVKDYELVLALPNRLFGVVPCNRISKHLTRVFSEYADGETEVEAPNLKQYYKEGEYVVCFVKASSEGDDDRRQIELSMLPEDVCAGLVEEELANGLVISGSVQSREDRGWVVDVGTKSSAFCNISKVDSELVVGKTMMFTLLVDEKKKSPVLQLSAKVNRLSEVFLKSDSLLSRRSFLPGNIVDVNVKEAQTNRYIVSLPGSISGILPITSLPVNRKPLKTGEKIKCRLVWIDADSSALASARESVLSLHSSFESRQPLGTKIQATAHSSDQSGVLFTSDQLDCFCQTSKLSDQPIGDIRKDLQESFKPKTVHEARVIGYDPFENLNIISLQPSILAKPFISYSGVNIGDVIKGEIVKVADYGLLVQLGDKLRAICPTFHLSDTHVASSKLAHKYSVGAKIRFRVLECDPDNRKVTLTKRKVLIDADVVVSQLAHVKVGMALCGYVVSVKANGAVIRFFGALTAFLPVSELSDDGFVESALDIVRMGQSITVKVKSVDVPKKQLIVSLRSNPKAPNKRKIERLAGAEEPPVVNSENVFVEERVTIVEPSKKKLKDIFEQISDKEEEILLDTESNGTELKKFLKVSSSKDVTDEFEKRLLATPNASVVWIEYAASLISIGNTEAARATLERALLSISIREQAEKLNIWTSLLNIENIYGNPASLQAIFNRALSYTEPKHLYLRLAEIYVQSGKHAEAGELFGEMQRKFKSSCKLWLASISFHLIKAKNVAMARKLLPQALKALPARKHVKCTLKCAQLEYKYGEVERARTLFEGLLATNPKRVDLWLVYIQMEENLIKSTSNPTLNHVRRIYERTLTLKLSSKKAKCFFKGFLEFEKLHGDAAGVEHVKQLAREFVEGKQQ